ncbi:ABC transporter substrate-binding protein [Erythrobacteraceae bacterium WH01K]|nr:ABC transporter substrate-binding protein [Erythrobacteraceae bacterium WH01K]
MLRHLLPFLIPAALALSSCSRDDGGPIDIVVVEQTDDLLTGGMRLSYGQQLVRGAVSEGLVTLDSNGETVPALAESWIVVDDGRSFIFRLRDTTWADGTPVDAASVRAEILRQIRDLEGTSLGLDLARVSEIRAMTGRVIEIRLSQPMPAFLQLLAQPELGLRRDGSGIGPMRATTGAGGVLLTAVPPQLRGLPEEPGFSDRARSIRIRALPAEGAVDAFFDTGSDLVVGGTLASLPLAETGPLSRGNVRLDSALGLFGLQVTAPDGFLADASRREALSMAIDRPTLLAPFNLSGWPSTTRIVPPAMLAQAGQDAGSTFTPAERWTDLSLEVRRSRAARRVADWEAASGQEASVSLYLPQGPGSDLLFRKLAQDFATIGVASERAADRSGADLVLVDRLARYAAPRWFLNQFHCSVRRQGCSAAADALVSGEVAGQQTPETMPPLIEAETLLVDSNSYIPLGAPLRWSLVRGGLEGFAENRWATHPLFPLAMDPIS